MTPPGPPQTLAGRADAWSSRPLALPFACAPPDRRASLARDCARHAHQPPGAQRPLKRSLPPGLCQTLPDEGSELVFWRYDFLSQVQDVGRQVISGSYEHGWTLPTFSAPKVVSARVTGFDIGRSHRRTG